MKKSSCIIASVILFFSANVNAWILAWNDCEDYCDETLSLTTRCDLPYTFGINYKEQWLKIKGDWQSLFIKHQPGFDVYFGWRFFPFVGIDLGYEWTATKPISILLPPGSSLLGVTNNSPRNITFTSRIRYKTGHADLNFFVPIPLPWGWCNYFMPEGIITVGVSNMKPHMRYQITPDDVTTRPFRAQFFNLEGRSKAVFRAGLGLQGILIENVGIRFIWRYEGTSVLRARNRPLAVDAATREIFGNAHTLAGGLFILF